mmetsp:Transcript_18983/g.49390  ORF Transcript_18983/g.49390 Transcript_18983/m.49390 type:complete len:83 (-) Transcript_18983:285-533(-)
MMFDTGGVRTAGVHHPAAPRGRSVVKVELELGQKAYRPAEAVRDRRPARLPQLVGLARGRSGRRGHIIALRPGPCHAAARRH